MKKLAKRIGRKRMGDDFLAILFTCFSVYLGVGSSDLYLENHAFAGTQGTSLG